MGGLIRRSLGDQIVELVRDRIVAGQIPPDTAIRQDALAQELGVSKIPLREAFARLEQEGLVVSEPNRGYFVRPLSLAEARDVFDLRLKIEPDAVRTGAAAATAADRAAAHAALTRLNAVTLQDAGTADHHLGALNRNFHVALIRPGDRPLTLQMIERLQVIAERYVVRHLAPSGRAPRSVQEHDALYAAWASGDGDRAAACSQAHIATTWEDLRLELGDAPDRRPPGG